MTAVVTSVHYRMTLALMHDLSDKGVRVVACYSGETVPFTVLSHAVNKRVQVPDNKSNPDAYVDTLYCVCEEIYRSEGEKPALMPVSTKDMELLSPQAVQDRFSEVCNMAMTSYDTLDFANNKLRIMELCERLGIDIPKTEHPSCREDFSGYSYPLIVKPVCGEKQGLRAGERYIVVNNPDEAVSAWEHFKTLCGETVVQSYLTGEVVAHTVVVRKGQILTGVTEGTIRTRFPNGGHPSYTYTMSDDICISTSRKLARELNLTGLFMFQYIRTKDGKLYMMEINCRVAGSYSVCRKAESSISYDWFAVSSGREPLCNNGKLGVYQYFFPSEVAYALEDVKAGNMKRALSELVTPFSPKSRDGLFELSDLRASIHYVTHYITERAHGYKGDSVPSVQK